MNFVDLPPEMIDHILSYISYEEIAKLRSVNKWFNMVCSYKLNQGFIQVERFHGKCLKDIKSKLPRRESERKNHPLSKHSDIMLSLESRLSMLSMTFTKYIMCKHCCFIPGKVLDEAMRLLRVVNESSTLQTDSLPSLVALPRPHEFLQEFRDISSMAIEYFDEKIVPMIREKMRENEDLADDYSMGLRSSLPQKLIKLVHFVKRTQSRFNLTRKILEVLSIKMNTMATTLNSHAMMIQQQKTTIDNLSKSLCKARKRLATNNGSLRVKRCRMGELDPEKQTQRALTATVTSNISVPGNGHSSGSQDEQQRAPVMDQVATTSGTFLDSSYLATVDFGIDDMGTFDSLLFKCSQR